jgi:hypothetical protein
LSAPHRIGCPYQLTTFSAAPGFDASAWLPGDVFARFFGDVECKVASQIECNLAPQIARPGRNEEAGKIGGVDSSF